MLVIGGAGFIGSHTADELEKKKYKIRILDVLHPGVHFEKWPVWVKRSWEKIRGDATDPKTLLRALKDIDYVVHMAALTDLVPNYKEFFDINVGSSALLYQLIAENNLPIRKIVMASSQFVYGEGRAKCKKHGEISPKPRSFERLKKGLWKPVCLECNLEVETLAYKETHQDPSNHYSITKYTQELIALKLGRIKQIPSTAMRYSIVQGPRQSVKNMYSGALRIFSMAMLQNKTVDIYEDGKQARDFVSVHDVAKANVLALENPKTDYENYNVGGGRAITVMELAQEVALATGYKKKIEPSGMFRVGDSRNSVSDISKIMKVGWKPQGVFRDVVKEYVEWMKSLKLDKDYLGEARKLMKQSGMVKKINK